MTQLPDSHNNTLPGNRFTLNLKPNDARAAFRLHYRRQFFSKNSLIFSLALFLAVAAISVLPSSDEIPKVIFFLTGFVVFQIIAFGLFAAVYLLVVVPYIGHKFFTQQLSLHEPMLICWNDSGFRTKSETISTFTPWENYRKLVENRYVVLLYQSNIAFQFIPKGALSTSQIADLRSYSARFVASSRR